MSDTDQSKMMDDEAIWQELRDLPVDWEEKLEQKKRDAARGYMLAMTPAQRLQRNDDARRIIVHLEAIAELHGLKAIGWEIRGPA